MRRLIILLLVSALVATSCGSDDEGAADTGKLQIVATTSILGDIVRHITDTEADVETLVPIGADPHDYTPSARQVAALETADLVVANGLGLEEGLEDILDSIERDGAMVLRIAPEVDPLPFAEPGGHDHGSDEEHHEEDGEAHDSDNDAEDHESNGEHGDHGDLDPHVWLDPVRMAAATELIGDTLAAIDPSIDWGVRARTHARRLMAVDTAVRETLSVISPNRRKLITNHEALGYWADRYEFEVVGVVIPGGSTLAEPSSAELARLVEVIEAEGVTAIFAETTEPSALAEAVAAEVDTDVAVVELYTGSLGPVGSGAATYVGMLLTNAERIADALR